jgi:hypothetical protein
MKIIDNTKLYTFNQPNRVYGYGDDVRIWRIDTAMYIIPYKIYTNERWITDMLDADGRYIVECYDKNKDIHIFVDNDLCYYNKLRPEN